MKMFFAQLSDKSYIHVTADKMVEKENVVYVYDDERLVAMVDVSMILFAHINQVRIIEGKENL